MEKWLSTARGRSCGLMWSITDGRMFAYCGTCRGVLSKGGTYLD